MPKEPLKIGHRGAKNHEIENTIASIQKALEFNVDGIEIDVHKCASGELVVFHDYTLDRMTNGSGEIATHTLDDLKMLRVNDKHAIPTLNEVLDVIDKRCIVNIELKGKHTAKETCKIIASYINEKGWTNTDFLVSSFQHRELEEVFKTNLDIRLGVLTKASVEDAITFAATVNAYAVHPNYALLTRANVSNAKAMGYKVITWTVNDIRAIHRMKNYAVDGIISDNPDRL